MKKYRKNSKILLDQQILTEMIKMKNMKIKLKSDDNLPLKKTLDLYATAGRFLFNDGNKCSQDFLDKCLQKLV